VGENRLVGNGEWGIRRHTSSHAIAKRRSRHGNPVQSSHYFPPHRVLDNAKSQTSGLPRRLRLLAMTVGGAAGGQSHQECSTTHYGKVTLRGEVVDFVGLQWRGFVWIWILTVSLWVVTSGGVGMRRDIYLSARDRVMVRCRERSAPWWAPAVVLGVRQRACQHAGARFIGR